MKYYKIVEQNNIVGVITSNDFIKYSPITDCYDATTDVYGEYASYQNTLYRSSWMQPIKTAEEYKSALIITISKSEYDAFIEALKAQEEIENVETEEEAREREIEEQTNIDPIDQLSIEFIRSSKISAMSYACRKAIEQGFDLILRGESHHFSLTTQDQLNLMNLDTTQELIPYHADGEQYTYYTADEIKQIINAANDHKVYHTAYYNSLKEYINTLETIEDIAAITYGTPIPDKYKSEVLKVFEEYTQPFHS